ncbi:MAG: D-glycerate dehydrogenase [Pigmentiphaga sp.]|uniref:2-hydroxyacid dehydrogenase n=1 Tax=Pigmentiphaga sp. TaxID=1977564 RepID=UPI0029B67AC3|nr:D-glycerate dehydrogenase [Pigmentiphaga sp.]MDX3904368.1 D-glycerate dehydrogenase [Pigmentiphaga sp.]
MAASRKKIVVSLTVPPDLRERLESEFDLINLPVGGNIDDVVPAAERGGVHGLLGTLRLKVDDDLLARYPGVEVVSNYAVGFDNIDVAAATKRNVLVCNTPEVLDKAVADLTMGLVLCTLRDMVRADNFVRAGKWMQGALPLSTDLAGKTLGLLGMGRIGRMVAARAKAFDMQVIYHNRRKDEDAERSGLARWVEREALFRQSDVVSVHVPLSDETTQCVGSRELGWMKPSAFLINTARGKVLDENALVEFLRERKIAGAGLDVMTVEPIGADHPLCQLDNVVLQPHVASGTVETRRAMMDLAVENLILGLRGERPRALVNAGLWPRKA